MSVDPAGSGAVAGAGAYGHGDAVTLEATAKTGYEFMRWTEAGVEVSTDEQYAFTAAADRELVANFDVSTKVTLDGPYEFRTLEDEMAVEFTSLRGDDSYGNYSLCVYRGDDLHRTIGLTAESGGFTGGADEMNLEAAGEYGARVRRAATGDVLAAMEFVTAADADFQVPTAQITSLQGGQCLAGLVTFTGVAHDANIASWVLKAGDHTSAPEVQIAAGTENVGEPGTPGAFVENLDVNAHLADGEWSIRLIVEDQVGHRSADEVAVTVGDAIAMHSISETRWSAVTYGSFLVHVDYTGDVGDATDVDPAQFTLGGVEACDVSGDMGLPHRILLYFLDYPDENEGETRALVYTEGQDPLKDPCGNPAETPDGLDVEVPEKIEMVAAAAGWAEDPRTTLSVTVQYSGDVGDLGGTYPADPAQFRLGTEEADSISLHTDGDKVILLFAGYPEDHVTEDLTYECIAFGAVTCPDGNPARSPDRVDGVEVPNRLAMESIFSLQWQGNNLNIVVNYTCDLGDVSSAEAAQFTLDGVEPDQMSCVGGDAGHRLHLRFDDYPCEDQTQYLAYNEGQAPLEDAWGFSAKTPDGLHIPVPEKTHIDSASADWSGDDLIVTVSYAGYPLASAGTVESVALGQFQLEGVSPTSISLLDDERSVHLTFPGYLFSDWHALFGYTEDVHGMHPMKDSASNHVRTPEEHWLFVPPRY